MTRTSCVLWALLFVACGAPLAGPSEGVEPIAAAAVVHLEPDAQGFPCAVRAVLETKCAGCHESNPYLKPLLKRSELPKVAPGFAARLTDDLSPMPPIAAEVALSTDERALLLSWAQDGFVGGACP